MTREQIMLRYFHRAFELLISDEPTVEIPGDVTTLRKKLIEEEFIELQEAMENRDIVKIADGLGDLLYVVYGTAVSYGIDMEPIFNEIHRSNMSKMWPDGKIHKNEFGKVVKPDCYSPAALEPLIRKQQNGPCVGCGLCDGKLK